MMLSIIVIATIPILIDEMRRAKVEQMRQSEALQARLRAAEMEGRVRLPDFPSPGPSSVSTDHRLTSPPVGRRVFSAMRTRMMSSKGLLPRKNVFTSSICAASAGT